MKKSPEPSHRFRATSSHHHTDVERGCVESSPHAHCHAQLAHGLLTKVRQIIHKGQEQLYTLIPAIELMVRTSKTGDESVFFIQSVPEFDKVAIGCEMPAISPGVQTIIISQIKIVWELIDKKLRDFTSLERTIEVETDDGEVVQTLLKHYGKMILGTI
eukprot:SAG11_NODE_10724_length_809_cov_3.436620_1_plen_159_part_00